MNWSIIFSLLTIISWIIPIVMLFIVPVNRRPSSATAWLLLMFAVPFFGLFVFLLIGNPRLPIRRRAQQARINELIKQEGQKLQENPGYRQWLDPEIEERYVPFVELNANLGAMPAFAGNTVELLSDYQGAIETIAREIEQAQEFVFVEYFALSRDEETEVVFAAMERAQKRGVKVHVLFDQFGSRKYPAYKKMQTRLEQAGIKYQVMLPLRFFSQHYTRFDLRNHRKIVVIDGTVGFTGSQNMIKRNYFRKDTIVYDEAVTRVQGPVAVQLLAVILTDWYAESGEDLLLQVRSEDEKILTQRMASSQVLCQALPSGSGFDNENNLKLFTAIFYAARERIVITNPYFVPDEALMTAITSAAQRGIEVTLINSEVADQFLVSHAQHSYYEQLLKAGVHIYWYAPPSLLHSKMISIDDDIAVIGSSNLDIRSFQLNMEITLICYDRQVVADMRQIEASYKKSARLLCLEDWQKRPLRARLFENISRLTSALQ